MYFVTIYFNEIYVRISYMKDKQKIIKKLNNALNANDLNSARNIIEKDLKRLNTKDEYYFYLALISQDLNTKLDLYTKAIESNPVFLDAYINRGLVENELGDYDASIADYNKALELDSKCALIYNNRGYTKYKQKDFQGALADYNKAILLNPNFQMAIDNKANLVQEVCLEDDKEFSEKFYLSRGILAINAGNFNDAIKDLNEALIYNKSLALAHFYKGVAYHNMCKQEEAFDCYSNAIILDKNFTDAYFNRGQLVMQEKPKQALDDFVKAVTLDTKFIDAYYSIAAIQKKLGQYKEAIANLDKIIELEPHAVNAKALKKLILAKYLK